MECFSTTEVISVLPSIEWLHFVAANRKKDLFPHLLKKYSVIDIIGGKIADDQTARTLQIYISGEGAGEPGLQKQTKKRLKNFYQTVSSFQIKKKVYLATVQPDLRTYVVGTMDLSLSFEESYIGYSGSRSAEPGV